MQIILIKNNSLRKLNLPKQVQGNFWITDLNENGNEINLINIEAIDGQWNLISNIDVYYVEKEKKIKQVILSDYRFYSLKSKNEYIYIYCCPTIEKSFKYYDITNYNQEITIGKEQTTITYNLNFLQNIEAKLALNKNYLEIIPNNNSRLGIFVNDYRITTSSILENGDCIFISGIKIIYLVLKDRKILIINNINNKMSISLKETVKPEFPNEFSENEDNYENKQYSDDTYFHRKPRFIQILEDYNLEVDAPPDSQDESKTPLLLLIGPMLTTSMMSVMYGYNAINTINRNNGNIMAGIFPLVMCFSMLAGTLLWPNINRSYQKKQRKKYEKLRQEKYTAYINELQKRIDNELINQQNILLINNPNLQECQNTIINKTVDLWQRRIEDDDFLSIGLGYGNLPMKINIKYPEEHFSLETDNLKDLALKLGREQKILTNVPISLSLRKDPILGIVGRTEETREYIKKIILQLIAFHSYDNLKIVILTDENNKNYWKYIKPLPHIYNDNKTFRFFGTNTEEYKEVFYQLDSIINRRTSEKTNDKRLYNPQYLIITDCFKSLRNFETLNKIFDNSQIGFSMIIVNEKLSSITDRCKKFVQIENDRGELFQTLLNNESKVFNIEQIPTNIEYCVKVLSTIPIEISNSVEGQMPKKLGFLEMYNIGKIEQLNIENRWKTSNPIISLNAPVGVGKSGEKIGLDLHEKYHGPHGLVAGMTGSGKSEFLLTYILSMAINYHPDEVQFILIDYKGGGLAGAFENQMAGIKLPHLVGTITNLDKNEIKRSLASIESELKRRQSKFNEAREISGESTIDIYKYQKMYRNGIVKEPISHLFIISDEFAELKAQEPEFMDQLISTARIGRSLGVHLILATQKPSGVVNAQIWSNTRFRVCLRVQDTSDSKEVIKCPDAAYLKEVGRFYFQVGENELFTIGQSAYSGTQYIPSEIIQNQIDTSINILNNFGVPIANLDEDKKIIKTENMGEELFNIVKYLSNIGKTNNMNIKPLWLPKIPELIFIESIKKQFNYKPSPFVFNPVIGLYDDPNSQYQGLTTIDLTKEGNTIIYGMSGSGEVLILETLIYSLSIEHTPQEVNIYIIDCGAETLGIYKNFPHVGDIALTQDQEKITNLFKMIEEEISKRKKLFLEYNGDYNYYCKNSGNTLPAITIIINNYDTFKETYENLEENIRVLSRDSIKYGIYIILTVNNTNGVRSVIRQNFNNLLSLQLTDDNAYNYIFGNIHKLTPSSIYGRGLYKKDKVYEFQTAHITTDEQLLPTIKDISEKLSKAYNYKAKKIPILPEIVTVNDIVSNTSSLSKLPIGIDKDTLEIVNYNFISKIPLILNEFEEDIEKTVNNFSKVLSLYSKVIVIDINKIITSSNKYIYINDKLEEITKKLLELSDNNIKYTCIIIGLNNLLKKLKPTEKTSFAKLIRRQVEKNSPIHFVIIGTADMTKGQEFEPWYQETVDNKSGIYIGNGIDLQNVIKIDNSYKLSKIKITNKYAFVIQKGNTKIVKIIEE